MQPPDASLNGQIAELPIATMPTSSLQNPEPENSSSFGESPFGRAAHRLFEKLVLAGPMPYLIVATTFLAAAFFAYHIKNFQMDASNDSILLENDKDVKYYNTSRELFGTDDYVVVVVTVKTQDELFSDRSLKFIADIGDDLRKMSHVESVMSILDVPLFNSPDLPLFQVMQGKYKTLRVDADRQLARKELVESAYCSDFLISKDGTATLIQVNFDSDKDFLSLSHDRQELMEKNAGQGLSAEEKSRLGDLTRQYKKRHAELSEERRSDIAQMREITSKYQSLYPELGTLHIGGIPLIISDMINYIEHDIWVFGFAAVLFMMLILALIFRSTRWVLIPMSACVLTVVIMIGYVSFAHWRTTIVTSNFASLLLILTLSTAIHIVSRYRELQAEQPSLSNRQLISHAIGLVFEPCIFMVATTAVGFASLILSGIRPVMDFGILMTIGLLISFFMCFAYLPAALLVFPARKLPVAKAGESQDSTVLPLAVITGRHPWLMGTLWLALFGVLALGIRNLSVEARFIDYFRKSSPIAEGMTLIDRRIGGTMPLEIVLDGEGKDYWIEPENLKKITKVHEFVDALPETSKVLSPETIRQMFVKIGKGMEVKKELILTARKSMPENLAGYLLNPYITPTYDKARIAIRIPESDETIHKTALRQKIVDFLNDEMKMPVDQTSHVTGYFVLYDNMINSLYKSQIRTVATVFLACLLTFAIVFRSLWLACIGLVPNVLAVVLILGTMGWMHIHLDVMTIMIAAVTFGLADDNTIHYIHRFRNEFPKDRNYLATMYRCHNTIGKPMSYTMVTTVFGFALLMLSDFVPTAYFGLFTALAMFIALLAAHTLLPLLIITLKPFGKESRRIGDQAEQAA